MAQIPCKKCDFCEDHNNRTSSFYCEECEKFLCSQCKSKIHDRVPTFQDHCVVDINQAGNIVFRKKPVCLSHKKEFLYYCNKCDCLVCKECMTSSHNGHTTDTIKTIVDGYRKNVDKIHENLKAKVQIVQKALDTIKKKQFHQIQSDYDSYVERVDKTSRELYSIVDHIKSMNITAAFEFQQIEKADLDRTRVFFQRHYDEASSTLLQFENLLHESHDVKFFSEWKRLNSDVQYMCEADLTLQNLRKVKHFSEDNVIKAVIEEIEKRFKNR